MTLGRSQQFVKAFSKLSNKEKMKFSERISIFSTDKNNPILNNHKLHGEYSGCRSINITGDIRLVYKDLSNDDILLYRIGTHSELYT